MGIALGELCKKIQLPALFGMLFTGIILGPYALDLIDSSVLDISAQIRKIALIIILTRAGLSLNISDLKKAGRPAVLMCFVPACFEIAGMLLLAPRFLGMTLIESAVLGAVIAAVSPAVIVPKMLMLMEKKCGTEKCIPQMILAGASVDDVFVIVMFSAFTSLSKTGDFSPLKFAEIPVSIILGVLAGAAAGLAAGFIMKKLHIRDTVKMIIIICTGFLLVAFEDAFGEAVPFSSLIGVMCAGIAVQKLVPEATVRISARFSKVWVVAEVFLFVLVGATVNISYALREGPAAVALILAVLLFRMLGVLASVLGTKLNSKERLFCMMAYLPKATVQAAIGGIPLAMGLSRGDTTLTVAVLSIIITAPLGAFLIDTFHKRLL